MINKIFFTDLDGTCLNDQKEITEGNALAMEKARENGCSIVISSGRPSSSVMIQAAKMGLNKEGCYAITYNGGEVIRCDTGESLFRRTLTIDQAAYLFAEARKAGIHCQTYDSKYLITEKETPEVVRYAQQNGSVVRYAEDPISLLAEDPPKVLMASLDYDGRLERFQEAHAEIIEPQMDSVFSCAEYLEYLPKGVSKGAAVRWLCEYLGVDIKDTVAAGDAMNDLSMLETCHVGVAMANADPRVKEGADYITIADNNHDGVAEIIEKFIL